MDRIEWRGYLSTTVLNYGKVKSNKTNSDNPCGSFSKTSHTVPDRSNLTGNALPERLGNAKRNRKERLGNVKRTQR